MTKERIAEIKEIDLEKGNIGQFSKISQEVGTLLTNDNTFFEGVKSIAEKTKTGNVGMIDLFTMIGYADSYLNKNGAYKEYLDDAEVKKAKAIEKDAKEKLETAEKEAKKLEAKQKLEAEKKALEDKKKRESESQISLEF